jgi:hypothetical protein
MPYKRNIRAFVAFFAGFRLFSIICLEKRQGAILALAKAGLLIILKWYTNGVQ